MPPGNAEGQSATKHTQAQVRQKIHYQWMVSSARQVLLKNIGQRVRKDPEDNCCRSEYDDWQGEILLVKDTKLLASGKAARLTIVNNP